MIEDSNGIAAEEARIAEEARQEERLLVIKFLTDYSKEAMQFGWTREAVAVSMAVRELAESIEEGQHMRKEVEE